MSIRFSIITPIFNREKCLFRAIQSVVNQSFDNWELILVNDGSTDSSESICAGFVQTDSRIKYIYQQNAGVSAARNRGLGTASGDYLLFLDADDFFQEDTLKRLNSEICAKNAPDLVSFGQKSETGGGWSPSEHLFSRIIDDTELKENLIPAFLNLKPITDYNISPMVIDKCYKRSLLTEHRIAFDEAYKTWEDGLFNAFVLKQIHSLVVIPDQLCVRSDGGYKSDDHLSSRFFSNMPENWIRQFELVEGIFGEEYDFSCDYGVREYWNIFHDLLIKSAQTHTSRNVFSFAVSSDVVQRWMQVLQPKTIKERILFKLIRKKNARLLQFVYRYL